MMTLHVLLYYMSYSGNRWWCHALYSDCGAGHTNVLIRLKFSWIDALIGHKS